MKEATQKFTAAIAALALISAGLGAVSAAPGSIDGTQTDTTTEVYISADKTMDADFNASGDTTWNLTVQSVPDTADLAMNVSHEGVEYYRFTGQFSDYSDGDPDTTASTTGEYHTFTDDELSKVPMNINENVTLNVTYWNESATNPTPTTVQVYVENGDERSVQRVTESSADTDVETVEPWWGADYNTSETESDNVNINGSETDVVYTLSDSVITEAFDNATERTEIDTTGSLALMKADVEADEDATIPMFINAAPDWYDAESMGSYAVYDISDDTVTFETEDTEFEDANDTDITMSSSLYGVRDAFTVFSLAGGTDRPIGATGAVLNTVM